MRLAWMLVAVAACGGGGGDEPDASPIDALRCSLPAPSDLAASSFPQRSFDVALGGFGTPLGLFADANGLFFATDHEMYRASLDGSAITAIPITAVDRC